LHPWTAYAIMPLFALANAGVAIELSNLKDSVALAVILGLVVGKPVGIGLMGWLAVRSGFGKLPDGVTWPVLLGGGCLAGIGFTMALFIEGLAFGKNGLDAGKTGVLVASALSALLGMGLLLWTLPSQPVKEPVPEAD
jgi:Na+:H+ antiporter, NhaA family